MCVNQVNLGNIPLSEYQKGGKKSNNPNGEIASFGAQSKLS